MNRRRFTATVFGLCIGVLTPLKPAPAPEWPGICQTGFSIDFAPGSNWVILTTERGVKMWQAAIGAGYKKYEV